MSYTRLDIPRKPSPTYFPMANFPIFRPLHEVPIKSTPMTSHRRLLLIRSYAPDWALTIILAAIFFALDKVTGYRRVFSLEDTSLLHPYAVHERVPNVALYMICFVAPLVIMPVINFITVRSWWDFHNGSLGLVLSLALTGAMTQIVKITVGRPRPDFVDRCQPPPGSVDPPFGLTSWTICTQTDFGIMNDGFRSFFSGHSSMSFAGLGFLSYYLAGKVHLFDKRGHAGKAWLALSPFMAASLVAISRTMDYRHHWQDVLVGSLIGTLFSFFGYRQYYPPLSSPLCHRPYSPRIKSEDITGVLPTHKPATSQDYPFIGGHHEDAGRFEDRNASYELAGTVPRQSPSLEEVWRQGAGPASDNVIINVEQPQIVGQIPSMQTLSAGTSR
ncbi:PAP2-domain-containing protein [Pholiota conissans]|uniref:PAP2-domain-containing protein n=1 Tax=Pholiota conissans TaxID=109636 RepID=A0A9P6CYJ7_9AGAR|nr:PAP2-domain-containing protein [Pholiota conissans]